MSRGSNGRLASFLCDMPFAFRLEFTSSDITSRLLAPECQLFGVVWPSEPLGHLIYPQNPKTYRSVIIKQRSTQSAAFRTSKIKEATNQHNSDNARQELNKQTGTICKQESTAFLTQHYI